jgi:hypothetical protein
LAVIISSFLNGGVALRFPSSPSRFKSLIDLGFEAVPMAARSTDQSPPRAVSFEEDLKFV